MLAKIIISLLFFLFLIPSYFPTFSSGLITVEGQITRVLEENGGYQKFEVTVSEGSNLDGVYIVENGMFTDNKNLKYKRYDRVILSIDKLEDGSNLVVIADHVRRPVLLSLFLIFVLLAVVVAGKWGLTSIIGMTYSFLIIFSFILPMIIKGYDAVVVSILGSIAIIPVTFTMSHGLNRKTVIAIIGTIISMVIIGILSALLVSMAKLTGFAAEEASFLQYQIGNLNMKGILLAGIIISSLGVMDDITISQSSVVHELKKANPKLTSKDLFLRSMNVGNDHISSMVNTLVLVYAGASLPLLLLFVNSPYTFSEVINYEIVAEEIVRTLSGSIGLILAVPITTLIAAKYSKV